MYKLLIVVGKPWAKFNIAKSKFTKINVNEICGIFVHD
jgi:hypothetical protein